MSEMPPVRALQTETNAPQSIHLAIHERLLYGTTEYERIQQAEQLNIAAVEFAAHGLHARVSDIRAVLKDSPVEAATVQLGSDYNFISPDEPTRQQALDHLRYAMTDAVDIGATGVVITPHNDFALGLPDLMPLKSPIQLAVELMVLHLRTLSDLAYVFGIKLFLRPVNRYESAFLNRLDQGVELRRRIKFNEHVMLAADTFHMGMSEDNLMHAIEDCANSVGHLYLTDNNGNLPGTGSIDFAEVRQNLGLGASGWAVVNQHIPNRERHSTRDLHTTLRYLRKVGF